MLDESRKLTVVRPGGCPASNSNLTPAYYSGGHAHRFVFERLGGGRLSWEAPTFLLHDMGEFMRQEMLAGTGIWVKPLGRERDSVPLCHRQHAAGPYVYSFTDADLAQVGAKCAFHAAAERWRKRATFAIRSLDALKLGLWKEGS